MKKRSYYEAMWGEFDKQKPMVLVSGPRQAGKTVLAKAVAAGESASVYFNYDVLSDRARLAETPAFFEQQNRPRDVRPLVVMDEIHKFRGWKNYLKGLYDGYAADYRFLITGSGRLDLFRQRGDSLAGRYLQFHVFPFTIGELFASQPRTALPSADLFDLPDPSAPAEEALQTLMRCGGFPEPFLRGEERGYRRWAATYHRQIVRNDIRDAFAVRDVEAMETLYALMEPRVGSPLSIAQLTDPLKVSHKTVDSWLSVFERMLLVFRVRPYYRRISRSLVKAPKFYFYDCCRVSQEGGRFENLVAVELKRAATNWTEYGLGEFDVCYLRNKDQVEVDFLLTKDGAPFLLVEAKAGDDSPAPGLRMFQTALHVPAVQLVLRSGISRVFHNGPDRILIVSAAGWLRNLA